MRYLFLILLLVSCVTTRNWVYVDSMALNPLVRAQLNFLLCPLRGEVVGENISRGLLIIDIYCNSGTFRVEVFEKETTGYVRKEKLDEK